MFLLKNRNEERTKSSLSQRNEEGTIASKRRNVQFLALIYQMIWFFSFQQGIGRSFFSRQSFLPRSFAKKRISFLPRSYFSKGTFVPSSFLLRSFLNIVNSRKTSKTSKETEVFHLEGNFIKDFIHWMKNEGV